MAGRQLGRQLERLTRRFDLPLVSERIVPRSYVYNERGRGSDSAGNTNHRVGSEESTDPLLDI